MKERDAAECEYWRKPWSVADWRECEPLIQGRNDI